MESGVALAVTPLVNTHTHTVLCGHGEGTVAELVAAACRAGVSVLAVTEHFPLSDAFNPNHDEAMPASSVAGYLASIEEARTANPGIEVFSGCEMDWLGDLEDRSAEERDTSRFEVVLGSVHFVDGWGCDNEDNAGPWLEEGAPDRIWERYVDEWCAMAVSSGRFDVLSHPDLPKKLGHYPTRPLSAFYNRMAEAAREGGRMVEVNTAGAVKPCREMYPALDLLRAFRRAGVPCTVGTDAHKPADVAFGIRDAYALMARAGYDCVTIPLPYGQRRELPIQ